MYGYIKPFKPELKVRELENYKAVYCGLCHTLKKRYGFLSSLLVNYDMTFQAMLMDDGKNELRMCAKRCAASPFKKKCYINGLQSLELAADSTVIFAYYKLCDNISDENIFKSMLARVGKLFIGKWFKKAAKYRPEIAFEAERYFKLLSGLEKENCASLDRMADCCGRIFMNCGFYAGEKHEIITQILYDISRFIYLSDAIEDYNDDFKKKRYNPIRAAYNGDIKISSGTEKALGIYMNCIINSVNEKLDGIYHGIYYQTVKNITTLGLKAVKEKVFAEAIGGKNATGSV